ncbi:epimerase [Marinobacterium aestuarii]|uniref:Epimerase n=1 Tax=Marinobacterium aestuarii TaxID=1821621 RepID=A0A1A9EUB0_9GAMM|nr:NAD-dependent epimerase/dehydratase family protein [Marinobacterium aestuarii]ANG61159.1 epimerase [Marinobacterium aestuarii]
MKILVMGGTGAMGFHLVSFLAKQGNQVVVTSRTRSGRDGNVEYVTGNARDERFITGLLNQHWDAIVDFMVYSTQSFQHRYRQLLNATGHYIYLSSSRVYANSEQPITENSPRLLDVIKDQAYIETDEYALSKARQENILFESAHKNWSIVRPYITYSDERLQLGVLEKEDWLYRALRGKTIAACRDIQSKKTTLTFGEDVAKGMAAILGQPSALGEAFHITSDTSISWSEVLDTYMTVLEAYLQHRPTVTLQDLDSFMQWRSGKYQIIYDRLYNRQFDNAKIDRYIDRSSFLDPRVGLAQCLESFITSKNPQFKVLNWREEGIKDRMFGERMPITAIPGLKQKAKYCISRFSPFA